MVCCRHFSFYEDGNMLFVPKILNNKYHANIKTDKPGDRKGSQRA